METFKLTEKQKYCLLQDAVMDIKSQGRYSYSFISPYECDRIKFNVGAFSRKNGCRVEVIYSFNDCTVKLLWHYVKKRVFDMIEDFVFVPKAITIDRNFKCSVLISIVPDPEHSRFIYQHTKSIHELCVEDSEEGEGGVPVGVCLEVADDDSACSKKMML